MKFLRKTSELNKIIIIIIITITFFFKKNFLFCNFFFSSFFISCNNSSISGKEEIPKRKGSLLSFSFFLFLFFYLYTYIYIHTLFSPSFVGFSHSRRLCYILPSIYRLSLHLLGSRHFFLSLSFSLSFS